MRASFQEGKDFTNEPRVSRRRDVRSAVEHDEFQLRHDLLELFESRAVGVPAANDAEDWNANRGQLFQSDDLFFVRAPHRREGVAILPGEKLLRGRTHLVRAGEWCTGGRAA